MTNQLYKRMRKYFNNIGKNGSGKKNFPWKSPPQNSHPENAHLEYSHDFHKLSFFTQHFVLTNVCKRKDFSTFKI